MQPETTLSSDVTLTITLPSEVLARLRAEVCARETASDRDVVEQVLIEGEYRQWDPSRPYLDPGLDEWMGNEGAKLVGKFTRGQMKSSPIDEAFERLERRIQPLRNEQ